MRFFLRVFCFIFSISIYATAPAQDSVLVAASNRYISRFGLRNAFVGTNYRDTWARLAKMPVFHLKDEKGGLTIIRLGGGAQTASLRLKDADGAEWVLRTVDKDVRIIVPRLLRGTPIHGIMQDIISTAYPYAPLAVAELSRILDVAAPSPALFFVPDDSAFGEYRKHFANSVAMLEKLWSTANDTKPLDGAEFMKKLSAEPQLEVDVNMYLKGRLLDMLIADWDRHIDQFKWGMRTDKGLRVYYPIFRDRDQAFFYSDGLILKKTRLFVLKHFTNFTRTFRRPVHLNYKGRKIDKLILKEMTENDWRSSIRKFQETISDSVIKAAIQKMPAEVVKFDGEYLAATLIGRRNLMMERVMQYYRSLYKKPR